MFRPIDKFILFKFDMIYVLRDIFRNLMSHLIYTDNNWLKFLFAVALSKTLTHASFARGIVIIGEPRKKLRSKSLSSRDSGMKIKRRKRVLPPAAWGHWHSVFAVFFFFFLKRLKETQQETQFFDFSSGPGSGCQIEIEYQKLCFM